ncbi:HTH-type transcriptional activator Btr [Brevibacillus reuszeri]|uniref:HTH-type transcriptional activator Btr n=1 Tax=Brevibacillus reuszeri TaxID=54915 RepID=A0A0K9YPY1_9BACL|nr:helix-turn-helix domain-containing protein [Brevibacillus reuszeri]KNB70712.1 hypothetical protein ADS79_17715 [Brevibacillus reuszeri]MED1861277.1 AraC family transcriptional regulator [Brevibacillus reuszeri]GED69819.1 HTH-type transcriptional activator Btr [Brevibacillus reuszeri]
MFTENDTIAASPTLFECTDYQHVRLDSANPLHLPATDYFRLLVVSKGKGELVVNEHTYPLSRTHALLFPRLLNLHLSSEAENELHVHCITFEMLELSATSAQSRTYKKVETLPFEGALPICSYSGIQRLMKQMDKNHHDGELGFLRQHACLYETLELLRPKMIEKLPSSEDHSFQQSIHYIQKEYDKPIMLNKLAKIAGVHPSYYSTLFKQKMGRAPIEYVTAIRMNRAKEILIRTNEKVSDVARQVGYKDEFYFSRRFKKQYGVAPSIYIKQNAYCNVVPLSYAFTDHLFTLNFVPHAAQITKGFQRITDRVPVPLERAESWNMRRELLLQVQPDLVVCKENISNQARENVGDIAPVIVIPWLQKDIFGHLTEIAELIDRKKAASDWIQTHEQLVEKARKQVAATAGDVSVTICAAFGEQCRIYGDRNMGHVFYRSLGLRPPERLQSILDNRSPGTEVNWLGVTLESILDYSSDYLFLVTRSAAEARQKLQQLQTYPGWHSHPAVKNNKVFTLHWDQWIVYAPNSIEMQLKKATFLLTRS